MCVVGGTGQFRVLPSQVTISSLESQMRTWATVPTVLTKHPPALFSPPTPALSIPSPGPISSRPQHRPADALYRPSPRALRRSPQEHGVPGPSALSGVSLYHLNHASRSFASTLTPHARSQPRFSLGHARTPTVASHSHRGHQSSARQITFLSHDASSATVETPLPSESCRAR